MYYIYVFVIINIHLSKKLVNIIKYVSIIIFSFMIHQVNNLNLLQMKFFNYYILTRNTTYLFK